MYLTSFDMWSLLVFGDVVNLLCPLAWLMTTMTEQLGPFLIMTEKINVSPQLMLMRHKFTARSLLV